VCRGGGGKRLDQGPRGRWRGAWIVCVCGLPEALLAGVLPAPVILHYPSITPLQPCAWLGPPPPPSGLCPPR
jgi:hypothetical protein